MSTMLSKRIAYEPHFKIAQASTAQGLPYDFNSIMQLSYNAFSKNNLSTILPLAKKVPKEKIGGAKWPSKQDYLDINLSYCGERNC